MILLKPLLHDNLVQRHREVSFTTVYYKMRIFQPFHCKPLQQQKPVLDIFGDYHTRNLLKKSLSGPYTIPACLSVPWISYRIGLSVTLWRQKRTNSQVKTKIAYPFSGKIGKKVTHSGRTPPLFKYLCPSSPPMFGHTPASRLRKQLYFLIRSLLKHLTFLIIRLNATWFLSFW